MVKEIIEYFYYDDNIPDLQAVYTQSSGNWPIPQIPPPTKSGQLSKKDNPDDIYILLTNASHPLRYTKYEISYNWTVYSEIVSNQISPNANPVANAWAEFYQCPFKFPTPLVGKILFIRRRMDK